MHNDLLKRQDRAAFVQNTHDDLFAELGRYSRDAKIDRTVLEFDRYATVLGKTALRNVQLCENLQARRERKLNLFRKPVFDIQDAVDTQSQNDAGFLRFDMD